MTGVGQRFIDAGFLELKPLIKIAGETIISHVMKMYPSISDPVFIISNNHPQRELLKTELKTLRPDSKIIEINPHKLGPSYAVWQAREHLDLLRPTIINYCDFGGIWDLSKMEAALKENDGAILTYTGFHPHMLRNTAYAYVKTDENGYVTDIQEKKSFTDDPYSEEASAGTYGFATGELLIRAIAEQIEQGISLKNEFYTSLTYKPLIREGKRIVCVGMNKFFQWGTPEDLRDWVYWRDALNEMINYHPTSDEVLGSTVILAAGRGSRLVATGSTPKPLVPVGKFLLWEYSGLCAIQNKESVVVTREKLVPKANRLNVPTVILSEVTQGQAITAQIGINRIDNTSEPITVLSCDNVIFQKNLVEAHEYAQRVDVIVWTASNYPPSLVNPSQYSWISGQESSSRKVWLKQEPDFKQDPQLIIGNFTFKTKQIGLTLISHLKKRDIRINDEFYLDSLIALAQELDFKVGVMDCKNFLAIGSQNEIQTFNYWVEIVTNYVFADW
jgi:NDP-sugar pyrophosphorylase family protein